MSMSKRRATRQEEMFVQTSALPDSPGHPFYTKLNELLAAHGFDGFVEERCSSYYAETLGRPSIPPGVYFRMLMIGYFEGLGSERGIDWRVADSLALRQFLGYALTETTPGHSSLSRIRQRLPLEVHQEVFNWVLKVLALEGLLKGKSVAVDATTLEANAALRSIVRRDTGEDYDDYLKGLAQAEGIETPTRQDLAKLDKKRPNKGSNDDWQHPHDPDARITKMKDGRTHLAHKAEHTVDLDTQAIVAINVCGADEGDTESLPWSLIQASMNDRDHLRSGAWRWARPTFSLGSSDGTRQDMARLPGALSAAHHHGRGTALVPSERDVGPCHVERYQLDCHRGSHFRGALHIVGFWAWKHDPNY